MDCNWCACGKYIEDGGLYCDLACQLKDLNIESECLSSLPPQTRQNQNNNNTNDQNNNNTNDHMNDNVDKNPGTAPMQRITLSSPIQIQIQQQQQQLQSRPLYYYAEDEDDEGGIKEMEDFERNCWNEMQSKQQQQQHNNNHCQTKPNMNNSTSFNILTSGHNTVIKNSTHHQHHVANNNNNNINYNNKNADNSIRRRAHSDIGPSCSSNNNNINNNIANPIPFTAYREIKSQNQYQPLQQQPIKILSLQGPSSKKKSTSLPASLEDDGSDDCYLTQQPKPNNNNNNNAIYVRKGLPFRQEVKVEAISQRYTAAYHVLAQCQMNTEQTLVV